MDRKHALVTGGNRGIGRAIAAGLAAQGHLVTLTARDLSAGRAVGAEIGAEAVALDLTRQDTFGALLETIPPVDILVNNAGVLDERSLLDTPEAFEEAMAVMVRGPYHLIRLTAPGMAARGWGRIVNVSSDWGAWASGLTGPGPYGVATAALSALTRPGRRMRGRTPRAGSPTSRSTVHRVGFSGIANHSTGRD